MAQTTKQAQERWLRFHAATLSAQEHPVETCTTTCSDLDRDRLIDGFSTEVVRDILATLAPGRGAGEDLVANELLRSGGEDMAALLSDLFVKSAAACSVPQEWRGGMVRNKKGQIPVLFHSLFWMTLLQFRALTFLLWTILPCWLPLHPLPISWTMSENMSVLTLSLCHLGRLKPLSRFVFQGAKDAASKLVHQDDHSHVPVHDGRLLRIVRSYVHLGT